MDRKRSTLQMEKKTSRLSIHHMKQRKAKTKKKPLKFLVDTQGGRGSENSRILAKATLGADHTLGYNPLLQKERDLAADLFGDDGEPLEKTVREQCSQLQEDGIERGQPIFKVEAKNKQIPPFIPDDPFDIHQKHQHHSRKPAWVDEDDQNIRVMDVVAGMSKARDSRGAREVSQQQYYLTLKQKFNQVVGGVPDWAHLPSTETQQDTDDGELVKGTSDYLVHGGSQLSKRRLEYRRLRHLNYTSRTEGSIITVTEFNYSHHVALVAGFSSDVVGVASLFKVDGGHNHMVHSIKFPKFPVKCAKFLNDNRRFVASSNQYGHFFVYDLEAGQETRIPSNLVEGQYNMKKFVVSPDGELIVFIGKKGQLHLFDADCLSYLDTLYAPAEVTAAAFNPSGSRLYTHTDVGDVCVWDMGVRACVQRFIDDGCIYGSSITVSPSNQYLACGSSSGVVNVYDLAGMTGHTPTPIKMLDHLCTPVSSLTFNSTSEILATASSQVEKAIKLVHFPSMTYFENFPATQKSLQRIQVVNFSPQSGFLSAGNNYGTAFLYRLHHYSSY